MKVNKSLLATLLTCLSVAAAGQGQLDPPSGTLSLPPSYYHIKRLRPDMDRGYAFYLSSLIEKYSKPEKVSPARLVSIAMQESGLRQINRVENGTITDVGMFQFHVKTIADRKLDSKRLKYDVEYQVESAAKLLRAKINLCNKRGIKQPWTCYHSATPSLANQYASLVVRWE